MQHKDSATNVFFQTFHKKYICNAQNTYRHDGAQVGGYEMQTLCYIANGWYSWQGGCNKKFLTIHPNTGKLSSENTTTDFKSSVRIFIHGLNMTTHFRHNNKYLCVEEKGSVWVNRTLRDLGTELNLVAKDEANYNIKTRYGKYLSIEGGKLHLKDKVGSTETFKLVYVPGGIALLNGGRALTVKEDTCVGILNDNNIGGTEFFTYDGIYPYI